MNNHYNQAFPTRINVHVSEAAAALVKQLSTTEEFSVGSKKIASFFRASEEHLPPGELLCAFLGTQVPVKMQEYFLFSLLDTGVSDFDLMKSLTRLHRLDRLIGRYTLYPHTLSDTEQEIIRTIREESPIKHIDAFIIARTVTSRWINMFMNNEDPGQQRRMQLSLLYQCEAHALRARTDWLSGHADTYNMKAMMRLLPLISTCDETAKVIIDLADYIKKGNMPGTPILSLELAMKTDAFEKWLKKISKQPECTLLFETIKEQRKKRIPSNLLVAVSTLTRAIQDTSTKPLSWIAHAVGCSESDGFSLEAGSKLSSLTPLLNQSGTEIRGTTINGNYLTNSFAQLIGEDNLTRSIDDSQELTIREIVQKCMRKDTLLVRLLDNPKVYNSPGLIERIAATNRSLVILQKIAMTRELHTGQANAGVPLALLKNPTNIPISLLRQFINTRYISMFEMRELMRTPYGIRRQVYEEVKSAVERRH